MHDPKFIKENSDFFDGELKKRNFPASSKKILEIYSLYINFLNETQSLQKKKNELSEKFKSLSSKNEIEQIKKSVNNLKIDLEKVKLKSEKKKKELEHILLEIPNLADQKVPVGSSEEDNKILTEWGSTEKKDFKILNHIEISEKLGLIDYEIAIKLSGSRFSVLKSDLSLLFRALKNFMLDVNIFEFNYEECVVPELVKSNCLVGTGQLPKFVDDLFKTHFNDLWLIPTAEVPLTNFHREEIINSLNLPLRYTAFTNCFRTEAGAAGKETKGLMREHQFGKVELVSIVEPNDSMNELNRMIECVQFILKKLELPYRLVELCSGDLGFSSAYTVDVEVWIPSQQKYREVSSCSNCKDFQSRRMMMRAKDNKTGKIFFPHTLNGSSIAIGRILIGVLENYQQSDGSIKIPKVLKKYLNNKEFIKVND